MASKGDLVEFKPGLFGLNPPENVGIFIRSMKRKKGVFVKLYTLKGEQETKNSNLSKKKFGEKVLLRGGNLPDAKEMKERLQYWIKEIQKQEKRDAALADRQGKLTEKALWQKALQKGTFFTTEELTSIWFENDAPGTKRIKQISEQLKNCQSHGVGYFTYKRGKPNKWNLLSANVKKTIDQHISQLGKIKNMMFQHIEVPIEKDSEETEIVRVPVPWEEISLNSEEQSALQQLQNIMAFYVENDYWPSVGLGDSDVHTIDGFSLFTFITYLAEDWIGEGRTSKSDKFVKLLLKSKYWGDHEALLAISKRIINLAPDFSWETPDEIEEFAAQYNEPSETPEVFENRLDLQELETYTIDPPTAKDFDDAITVIKLESGYILWVHIADVANYVPLHSKLDRHAQKRSTSVYLPTAVLPMLPHRLSDDLCSLNAQKPRLAMSVKIKFDANGKKIEESEAVYNTVINVRENLSYDYVNEAITKGKEPFTTYNELAELINQHRKSLNLETPDIKLEMGEEMTIKIKNSSASTKLIETFMVAANEAIGEIFARAKVPAIYRCHGLPAPEDLERFNGQNAVLSLPYSLSLPDLHEGEEKDTAEGMTLLDKLKEQGSFSFGTGGFGNFAQEEEEEEKEDIGTPLTTGIAQLSPKKQEELLRPFITVLDSVRDLQDYELQRLAYLLMLRVFPQAFYTAGNIGHFGLGSEKYVHFTSPIRRYPDLIAHRICKVLITENRRNGKGKASEDPVYLAEEIEELALHATEQTVTATKVERQVIGAGFAFFAKNQSYEQRLGIVSSISGGGVFVLLANGIEARIPLSQLTSQPTFVDDLETMCFIGARDQLEFADEITPNNYKELLQEGEEPIDVLAKIGDKVAVEFTEFDYVEGRISARPVTIFPRREGEYHEGDAFTPQIDEDEE